MFLWITTYVIGINFWFSFLRRNLNYAAAGNSIGFAAGMFIGSTCFTLLVSEQFSNLYLNTSPGTGGLITMKSTKVNLINYILWLKN